MQPLSKGSFEPIRCCLLSEDGVDGQHTQAREKAMADILERLRNRQAKFGNTVKGWIEYNLDDERVDEDAVIEIERLRGIEAKLKELIGMLGAQESTLDLNVPLAFRDLKDRLNETRKLTAKTPTNIEGLETAFDEVLKIAKAK